MHGRSQAPAIGDQRGVAVGIWRSATGADGVNGTKVGGGINGGSGAASVAVQAGA